MDREKEKMEMMIKALTEEVSSLKAENQRLLSVLKDNDLLEEANSKVIAPEEEVCVLGISQILQLVKNSNHTPADIKNFDILHNHLLRIRGKNPVENKKAKATNVADLLKIVKESNG